MTALDIRLTYGSTGRFQCWCPSPQVVAYHCGPPPLQELSTAIDTALESPLDFPPLRQALTPGDHVVIALDRHTPGSSMLIRALWNVLSRREVHPEDVLILQPASFTSTDMPDPRSDLPEGVRERVRWQRHDPTDSSRCAYLASTTSGHRIYLAREIVDADIVLTVGTMAFDSVLGYRGTNSVLYPGLSSVEDVRKAHGQGHDELGPDEVRAVRQTIDEVGWLLGVQFTLQVVPAAQGEVAAVLAGNPDAVYSQGRERLAEFLARGCR